MKKQIRITAGSVTALAELHHTRTADEIWRALPLRGKVNTWGEEIYFGIPVKLELEQGRDVVDLGSLGYWPTGNAFCIFFGPTPMSSGGKIRPASAVNVFGSLVDDPKIFKNVQDGDKITVERVEKPS
jgi:hypothetical protein